MPNYTTTLLQLFHRRSYHNNNVLCSPRERTVNRPKSVFLLIPIRHPTIREPVYVAGWRLKISRIQLFSRWTKYRMHIKSQNIYFLLWIILFNFNLLKWTSCYWFLRRYINNLIIINNHFSVNAQQCYLINVVLYIGIKLGKIKKSDLQRVISVYIRYLTSLNYLK